MWYLVVFDTEGDDDIIARFDTEPTDEQYDECTQIIGYLGPFGPFQCDSEAEAVELAVRDANRYGGCIA